MIENEIRETTNKEVPMSKKTFTVILGNGEKVTRKSDHVYTHASVLTMDDGLRQTSTHLATERLAKVVAEIESEHLLPVDSEGWHTVTTVTTYGDTYASRHKPTDRIERLEKEKKILAKMLQDLPSWPVGSVFQVLGFHHSRDLALRAVKSSSAGIVEVRSEVR